jgi:hypothetical protein
MSCVAIIANLFLCAVVHGTTYTRELNKLLVVMIAFIVFGFLYSL